MWATESEMASAAQADYQGKRHLGAFCIMFGNTTQIVPNSVRHLGFVVLLGGSLQPRTTSLNSSRARAARRATVGDSHCNVTP